MPSQMRGDTLCFGRAPDGQGPLSPDRYPRNRRADDLLVQLPRREDQTRASRVRASAEAPHTRRPPRTTSRSGGADDGFATNGAVCEHLRRRSRRCWYWTASDSERFRGSARSRRSRSSDGVIAAALCSTPECAAQLSYGRRLRVARESRLNPPAAIRARDQGATLASPQGDILQGAPTKQTPVGRQRSRVEARRPSPDTSLPMREARVGGGLSSPSTQHKRRAARPGNWFLGLEVHAAVGPRTGLGAVDEVQALDRRAEQAGDKA
jgi:hypothetical protein